MGDFREPNGVVLEESPVPSSSSSLSLSSFSLEVWARAEQATHEIILQVQPTVVSEERRRDVVDYVQRLLRNCLGCEIFPFGSVPLKTYLPDGDIDLTAFCAFNFEEAFANDVYSVLVEADHNPASEFVVKDVQYIRAEVKLVKCLVQNIVVDISFNQIGGLCALCFLEEVDRLIGKDHLFKRSIILIKAWCYYESRILGAHHGLISTYALETLVLYIFHLFHSSLNGPLAVLHKFLDYFSKFDWENFCVSLNGPVHVSSLPEIVAESPKSSGDDLLLSDDFLKECVKKFSVPSRGNETNYRTFMQKHLNIVDPLKENNNLGRSVSKGNFFRIRSAFTYGARKLGQILLQPQESIAEEVRKFFTNTLDRHGKGQRPDVQDLVLPPGCNGFAPEVFISVAESRLDDTCALEEVSVDFNDQSTGYCIGSGDTRHGVVSNFSRPGTYMERIEIEHRRGVYGADPCRAMPASQLSENELSASASRHSGDATDLATYGIQELRIVDHSHKPSPYTEEDKKSPLPNIDHASNSNLIPPQPFENGMMENGYLDDERPTDSSLSTLSKKFTGRPHTCHDGRNLTSGEQENVHLCNNLESDSSYSFMNANAHCLGDSHYVYRNKLSSKTAGSHETTILHPDLSGDVEIHLENLGYGRWWFDHGLQMTMQPIHLTLPPVFQPKIPWDAIRHSVHFRRDVVPQMNGPRPAFFPMNSQVVHGTYNVDEMPKARGTGTYFPITNHHSYREKPFVKGRSQGQLKSPRTNGRGPASLDRSSQVQSPGRPGVGRPKSSDFFESSPRGKVYKEVNGFVHTSEKAVESLAPGHPPLEAAFQDTESCEPLDSVPSPGSQNGESVFIVNGDRLTLQSYHLKDDEDFPPLSV
ncbi:uncharacterized protein LOC110731027 isoform X1 [Chenopodium quinoa]|uniref:PAP/OAS1 substrate-binding domain superfamily n=1 Tax=Chenopodium quinoa TaxID=63459 RepID=A0A803L3D2_CHEQI|nr:uncharacterized protein LOC110731027 isoform X1 [Chenopodium quinoa]